MKTFHVYFLLLGSALAFYEGNSPVTKLTKDTFQTEVLDSSDLWMVEFFAPWCGHCKKLAPEWEKAAKALKGVVKIGAVDMTTDGSVGQPYDIKGYPTIKFFGEDKTKVKTYEGGRTAKEITDFAMKKMEALMAKRMGGKKTASPTTEATETTETPPTDKTEESVTQEKVDKPQETDLPEETEDTEDADDTGKAAEPDEPAIDDRYVVHVNEDNFDEEVLQSQVPVFVDFYASWCDHCKAMRLDWARLARTFRGMVKIAKVNAAEDRTLADKHGVKSYPTLQLYLEGSSEPIVYDGLRDYDAFFQYLNKELNRLDLPPKIWQVTSEAVFNDTCPDNESKACIIVFLPHILDSSASERYKYLSTIQTVVKSHRTEPFAWMWTQAGDYFALEQKTGVGFGYPAVLTLNLQKSKFAVMKGAFTGEQFDQFLTKLLTGKVALLPYVNLPKFGNVTEWDGQDGHYEEEESTEPEQKQPETKQKEPETKQKQPEAGQAERKKEDL